MFDKLSLSSPRGNIFKRGGRPGVFVEKSFLDSVKLFRGDLQVGR